MQIPFFKKLNTDHRKLFFEVMYDEKQLYLIPQTDERMY